MTQTTMKRLLSLILLLLVATSSAHLSYAQGLERRFLNKLLIYPLYRSEAAAYRLVGDVESVKTVDYDIDEQSGSKTITGESTITFNNRGDVVKCESKERYECNYEKHYFHYASNGRPLSSVEEHYYPNGSLNRSHYDEIICKYNDRGQLVAWHSNKSEDNESYQYNYEGKLMSMTFYYYGYSSEYTGDCIYKCNLNGRIVEVCDEINRFSHSNYKFEYDSNGQIIAKYYISDTCRGEIEFNEKWTYKYDPESRVLEGIFEDSRVTYKYDARGSLIQTAYYKGNNTTPYRIIEHQIIYRY